jgi:hypothetical protein
MRPNLYKFNGNAPLNAKPLKFAASYWTESFQFGIVINAL